MEKENLQYTLDELIRQGNLSLMAREEETRKRLEQDRQDRAKMLNAVDVEMRKAIPVELHAYLESYKGRTVFTNFSKERRVVVIGDFMPIYITLVNIGPRWELASTMNQHSGNLEQPYFVPGARSVIDPDDFEYFDEEGKPPSFENSRSEHKYSGDNLAEAIAVAKREGEIRKETVKKFLVQRAELMEEDQLKQRELKYESVDRETSGEFRPSVAQERWTRRIALEQINLVLGCSPEQTRLSAASK